MTQPPRTLSYRRPMMSGGDVLGIQRQLAAHGFGSAADADGLYGPATEARVRAFQAAQGLVPDGIVGPATRRALRRPAGTAEGRPSPAEPACALALDEAAVLRGARAIARLAPAWLSEAGRGTVRKSAAAILRAGRDLGATDPSHLAYMLATAEHESNLGRNMCERWGPTEDQKRYETNPLNGRPGDGRRFLGRGFVQITFRANYARYTELLRRQGAEVDLVARPERAAEPGIAARVLVIGMAHAGFTSPKRLLATYGADGAFDFYRAREIVNGDKARPSARYGGRHIGTGIANQAEAYRQALLEAA